MTSADPPVVIDYAAFPHIIDAILDAASWELLLAFRGTSKDFQTRVSAIMGRHIVVSTQSERVSDKELQKQHGLIHHSVQLRAAAPFCGRIPGYNNRTTHIVDLKGGLYGNLMITQLLDPLCGRVDVVRLRPGEDDWVYAFAWARLLRAPTLVSFGEPGLSAWWHDPLKGGEIVHPSSPGKVVVNVRHLDQPSCLWDTIRLHPAPDNIRDVVVVCGRWSPPRFRGAWASKGRLLGAAMSDLLLNRAQLHVSADVKVTLVDLDCIDPHFLGVEPRGANVEQCVRGWIAEHLWALLDHNGWLDADTAQRPALALEIPIVVDKVDRVRFVSGEAYRDMVGDEQYLLETKE